LTRAKAAFTAARLEIAELLTTAKQLSDQVAERRRMSAQENQLRQIAVALVATLQAYVSELLEEKADEIGEDWKALSDLQRRYVAVHARRRLDAALLDCDENELAQSSKVEPFRKTTLDCADWFMKPSLLARTAYRMKLDGFLGDNGTNTLNQAISRFGIGEMRFFNWLAKHYPRYRGVEDQLDVLIATRNDVAHGTFERRLTMHDTRIYRVLIYRMIAKIEIYVGVNGIDNALSEVARDAAGAAPEAPRDLSERGHKGTDRS
jgi:hypothetical protein